MEINRVFEFIQGFCSRKRSRSQNRHENFNTIKRRDSIKFNPFIPPGDMTIVFRSNSHLPASPKYLLRTLTRDSSSISDLQAAVYSLKKMKSEVEKTFEKVTRTSFKMTETFELKPKPKSEFDKFLESRSIKLPIKEKIQKIISKLDSEDENSQFNIIDEFTLTIRDIKKLRKHCWLNDQIINSYIKLIKPKPDVHIFNTYFFQCIENMKNNVDPIKLNRMISRSGLTNLTEKPYIIIPANIMNNHWVVIAINNVKKTIEYFDSKGTRNMDLICEIIEKCLVGLDIGCYDWEGMEVPYQQNNSDCGVFALKIVKALAGNKEFDFVAEEMKFYRKIMMYELKKGWLVD